MQTDAHLASQSFWIVLEQENSLVLHRTSGIRYSFQHGAVEMCLFILLGEVW